MVWSSALLWQNRGLGAADSGGWVVEKRMPVRGVSPTGTEPPQAPGYWGLGFCPRTPTVLVGKEDQAPWNQ